MTINSNSSDKVIYLLFRDSGPVAALIVPAFLLNLVSNLGVLLNCSVIYVTIRSKSLHGSANLFLALISLYEILHQIGHLLLLIIALSGINFITILSAMQIEAVSVFGENAVSMAITVAAADRLFAIIAPIKRKSLNKLVYFIIGTFPSIIYGLYITVIIYQSAADDPYRPVTGLLSDLFDGPQGTVWFMDNSVLYLIAILCYFVIWWRVKRQQGVTQNTNSRLLKSLLAIVIVNICGYMVNTALYRLIYTVLCPNCYNTSLLGWQLSFIAGILMNMAAASNAPILYFTSIDYKKAFKCHIIGRICKFKWNSNATNPLNINLSAAVVGSTSMNATRKNMNPPQRPIERVIAMTNASSNIVGRMALR